MVEMSVLIYPISMLGITPVVSITVYHRYNPILEYNPYTNAKRYTDAKVLIIM